ncbi:MAG TPA: hypothetical protein VF584_17225 [Longimicrobium sp.]|jgi:hypothetical protein
MSNSRGPAWLFSASTAVVVVLALLYLISIPMGWTPTGRRFVLVDFAIFLVVVIAASGILGRLDRLVLSDKGVEFQLQSIKDRQKEQDHQLRTLGFLITHFLPKDELGHLWGEANDKPFPFEKTSKFEDELRRLRGYGLIEGSTGTPLPLCRRLEI